VSTSRNVLKKVLSITGIPSHVTRALISGNIGSINEHDTMSCYPKLSELSSIIKEMEDAFRKHKQKKEQNDRNQNQEV